MIWRIHRHVMRMLGEQLRIAPASHTLGISAGSVWTVSRPRLCARRASAGPCGATLANR
jgi:hypothetical protein